MLIRDKVKWRLGSVGIEADTSGVTYHRAVTLYRRTLRLISLNIYWSDRHLEQKL